MLFIFAFAIHKRISHEVQSRTEVPICPYFSASSRYCRGIPSSFSGEFLCVCVEITPGSLYGERGRDDIVLCREIARRVVLAQTPRGRFYNTRISDFNRRNTCHDGSFVYVTLSTSNSTLTYPS